MIFRHTCYAGDCVGPGSVLFLTQPNRTDEFSREMRNQNEPNRTDEFSREIRNQNESNRTDSFVKCA